MGLPDKKGVGLIIGIGGPKTLGKSMKGGGDDSEGGSDSPSIFREYADDVFDALKGDDKAAFSDALKSAIHACYDEGDSGDDEHAEGEE